MAIPTIVGVGASAAGQAAITPAFPGGYTAVADDVGITFLECESGDTITIPSGWALVVAQSVTTGTVTKLTATWRRIQGGDVAPQYIDAGNHQIGRMIIVRGCITTGNPWDQAVVQQETVSDTSVSMPTVTTSVADCLILNAFSTGRDVTSTVEASAWTNANLADPSITEQMDSWTALGLGGGFGMAAGGKAAAGATGATTATVALANFKALMTIALKPAAAAAPPMAMVTYPFDPNDSRWM